MASRIAAFACGVIILYSGLLAPPQAIQWSVGCAIGIACLLRWAGAGRKSALLLFLLAGCLWAAVNAQWRLQDRLAPSLEGEVVQVTGVLCDVPVPGAWDSVRFSLCLGAERPDGVPSRLRLGWYGDDATLKLPSPMRANVVLKRPHGAVNPAGFRYETWLFRKGYGATGSVRSVEAFPYGECGPACHYHRWRQNLVAETGNLLADSRHRALILSLLLGYRGELTPQHWSVLEATGTIHLVAISGLHLGLVAGLVAWLCQRLWLWGPGRPQISSRQRTLLWAVVAIAALGYALLAGFTVPTRRALVMVVIAGWLVLRGRLASPWRSWVLALGIVLALDPASPLDQGFWLSFAAVAVLIMVFSYRHIVPKPLPALFLAQLAVFAGLWPILTLLGQGVAWAGLLANLVAIPWLSLVVMPALVVGGLLLVLGGDWVAVWLVPVMDLVIAPLWWWLTPLASAPFPGGFLPLGAALCCALLAVLCLWVPGRSLRLTVAAVVIGVLVLAGAADNRWQPVPQLWVWDVGQGLSMLLQDQDQTLLYDTGPESASGYNAVTSVLMPSFDRLGVRHLNTVVLSHGDRDHAGGLDPLLERYQPDSMISGEPERIAAMTDGYGPVIPCRQQPPVQVGRVRVLFWQAAPPSDLDDANDRSCVVVLSYGKDLLVMPGDISRGIEEQLLADWSWLTSPAYRRTVIAPHHGSSSSSGPSWVRRLTPEEVIFSAGYRHRYGHPHPDVVARYQSAGATLHSTATAGALKLRLLPDGPKVTYWRRNAPFWIRPPEPVSVDPGAN